jgi:hypothetical protein
MDLKNDIHLSLEASVNIVLKVHNNSYWPQQKTIIVYNEINAIYHEQPKYQLLL